MTRLCKCGCGNYTNKIIMTSKKYGYVIGEYFKYLAGHHNKTKKRKEEIALMNKGNRNGL